MWKKKIPEKISFEDQQYDLEHGWVRIEGKRIIYFNGTFYVFRTGDVWRIGKTPFFLDAYAIFFKNMTDAKVYADSKK